MKFQSIELSHRGHGAMTQRAQSRIPSSSLRVRALCPLWLTALVPFSAARADIVFTQVFTVGKNIADLGELADVRAVSFSGGVIDDVTIGLRIDTVSALNPAASGDYYVGLGHDTGYAVLLNRIGKTLADEGDVGSGHGGVDVTFNDAAANGDIHLAPFDDSLDAPPALTGAWAPDGRTADPGLASSSRTATLSTFNGLAPGGAWELLIADDSRGGVGRLVSWSVSLRISPSVSTTPIQVSDSGGALTFDAPQTLTNDLVNQGRIIGPSAPGDVLTLEGHVSGAGDYEGNFVFTGSFSPGNSPAAVTFDGDLVFAPSHVLTMEIGGTAPGTGYDTISVTGTLGLGGTLNVVFINGFVPQPSDVFQFFPATSIAGSFVQVNLPFGYTAVGAIADGADFTLATIPEPAFAGLWGAGAARFVATRRRRVRGW